MESTKGSIGNPYSRSELQSLLRENLWRGGFVLINEDYIVYYYENGTPASDVSGYCSSYDSFGSGSNGSSGSHISGSDEGNGDETGGVPGTNEDEDVSNYLYIPAGRTEYTYNGDISFSIEVIWSAGFYKPTTGIYTSSISIWVLSASTTQSSREIGVVSHTASWYDLNTIRVIMEFKYLHEDITSTIQVNVIV